MTNHGSLFFHKFDVLITESFQNNVITSDKIRNGIIISQKLEICKRPLQNIRSRPVIVDCFPACYFPSLCRRISQFIFYDLKPQNKRLTSNFF